ncbi:MAG TPA: glycosyl hydrolase family 28-related protein, partial [Candidatus Didemnitutus sp.]|nr:glycosyl hydrolase family 28-related protein [Candidatus Didemnitutus sp.]
MNPTPLSRRQWLGRVTTPVLAASFGSTLVTDSAAADSRTMAASAGESSLGARIYDVRRFGAKGDGATLDTAAVQAAIDACHRDRGGVVSVPAGDFVVGTVELKSNVTLRLAAQGRLLGSANPADYRAGDGLPASNGNIVLLFAANAENVSIEGNGTIDG